MLGRGRSFVVAVVAAVLALALAAACVALLASTLGGGPEPPASSLQRELLNVARFTDPKSVAVRADASSSSSSPHSGAEPGSDPCDNVLLYLPEPFAHHGHGSQLNSYLLAIMVGAFWNKRVVLLEPPDERSEFAGGSQFGCPQDSPGDGEVERGKFPGGLSRLVDHPEWISGGCPVPCRGSHGYDRWRTVIKTGKLRGGTTSLRDPPTVRCRNDDGRRAKVTVAGGWEVRHVFDEEVRDAMVRRPSRLAYGWAVRLGASEEEAEIFATLEEEEDIWDYVAALLTRSGAIRWQPWIKRDVDQYLTNANLPREKYDAIHVRRGDKLISESKRYVVRYWRSIGRKGGKTPTRYIPFEHYLRPYDNVECQSDVRVVFVATDDPDEVRKEIGQLPKDDKGNAAKGCHRFQFVFGPTDDLKGFHIDAKGNCIAKYARNVAAIADLSTIVNSDLFVGEFNSNWGRLVRILRMRLLDGGRPAAKEIRVAWGNAYPGPPGV